MCRRVTLCWSPAPAARTRSRSPWRPGSSRSACARTAGSSRSTTACRRARGAGRAARRLGAGPRIRPCGRAGRQGRRPRRARGVRPQRAVYGARRRREGAPGGAGPARSHPRRPGRDGAAGPDPRRRAARPGRDAGQAGAAGGAVRPAAAGRDACRHPGGVRGGGADAVGGPAQHRPRVCPLPRTPAGRRARAGRDRQPRPDRGTHRGRHRAARRARVRRVRQGGRRGGGARRRPAGAAPAAGAHEVLHSWARRLGVSGGALSHHHVVAMDALVTDWHGQGPAALPGGLRVARQGGRLRRIA